MSFRYSPKITLEKGDNIRVSAGPYYMTKAGVKINMAERGKATFISVTEDGKNIRVSFKGQNTSELLYIGPEYFSESTGMTMRPYKITKIRKKK